MYRVGAYAIALLVIISAFPTTLTVGNAESDEDSLPEWGFYVYMAGDNTLYEEVTDDLNEMKMVGSNSNLEIVALTDQLLGNDSHAYHVVKHGVEETPLSEINATWENEIDMGNGETLKDFMVWATTEYPAQRKILVIWNHGSGWKKVAEDQGSHLTVPEIRKSIEDYREITGDPPLTLIGFDACLMGMFEIAYELKDQTEMIHGSEAYEPLEGWTYNHLLYKLDQQTTNAELAHHIVNDYIESYRNGSVYTGYSVTAAVVDTSKLEGVWDKLEDFSDQINSVLPVYRDQVSYSRDQTQRYDQNPDYRDLYDLTINVENWIPVSDMIKYSKDLQHSINNAVIAEDHWQKPGKLPVERAHGLTIYFPTDGADPGYDELLINDNKWSEFINNFATEMEPKAHFLELTSMSVDTGTGYNDSVLVSGSYEGNASEVRIRLLNSEGNVTNIYNGNISLGDIPGIYLQPTKSGNYSLEIGIYGGDGFLEDHYINDNLFVDLHLPDLAVGTPEIMIEGDDGGLYQVQNIQTDDIFLIQGSVYNLGTVKANNVTVSVNDNGYTRHFDFPEIGPNQEKTWNIYKNGTYAGEYFLDVSVSSEDEFEIDGHNNQTSLSFFILDKQAHEYNVDTKNKNLLKINTNQKGEYEFPWLEIYVTVSNDKVQSWDFMTITAEIPDNWEFEAEPFLQLSTETEVLVKVRPPLHTEMGEYKIELNLTDRNGFAAGNGEITVNVPQYYGVSIYAEQVGQEVKISISNSGNGKDYFKLTKDLEEGLTLYLTETYFEMDAFSSTTITALGMKTNTSKNYDVKFTIQSIGNENITAEVILEVTYLENQDQVSNWLISTFLGTIGMIGIIYFIYQRRIQ
uniref:Thrombospondin type 3 repeat family protein n=1 Tax=uncultured marine group II/III euryarchaeote AD1000_39_C04 TaxID=1457762 RepID=A0A075FPK2_9EURY|nr:thrombospondin type 3 repeat family protein [uncultured marine group II/III euryarchaeote AD1000_39_C04]